jgi:hypothetical protein
VRRKARRKAKKLPELIERLQSGRNNMAARLDSPDFTDEQRKATEGLLPQFDEKIQKARQFRNEFEATGDISDPAFDEWYSQAHASATFGNMTQDELQAVVRMERRFG